MLKKWGGLWVTPEHSPLIAKPAWRGSKFRRGVGGPLVGGLDIMVSSEPKSVVHLACWPLRHYAFRVAKRTSLHKAVPKPYRAVRSYCGIRSACAGSTRARGRLAHACSMRSGARASELLYASTRRETVASSLPWRVFSGCHHLFPCGPIAAIRSALCQA